MSRSGHTSVALGVAGAFLMVLGIPHFTEANELGYEKYGHGGGYAGMRGYGRSMMHSGAGHLIRHLLNHEKDIGLTADQVAQLKDIQLNLDKARIRAEADIRIVERELRALTDDEKSDLGEVEAKLRQSEDLQIGLRMTSIKTRREVLGLLTQEQREKEKTEHEKVIQQHREGGKSYGYPHGGVMPPHGSGPYGKNPHKGYGNAVPPSPSNEMSVQ